MRTTWTVILFCTFVFAGYKFAISSWGGVVYVYLGEERAPAAIRNSSDYSEVSHRNLGAPVEAQLVSEAEVAVREGAVGIYLGNPLLRTTEGLEFACQVKGREGVYDRIEMSFMGTGISTSGDTAELIVEAPCEAGEQAWALAPIWIPIKQIVSVAAKDADYQTDSEHPVTIHLRHVADEWPPQWVLSRVKLFRADDDENFLELDAQKMRVARSALLSFDTP